MRIDWDAALSAGTASGVLIIVLSLFLMIAGTVLFVALAISTWLFYGVFVLSYLGLFAYFYRDYKQENEDNGQ